MSSGYYSGFDGTGPFLINTPPLKDPKSEEFGPQYLFGKFEPPKCPSTYQGMLQIVHFLKVGTFDIPKFSRCARPICPVLIWEIFTISEFHSQ